MCVWWEKGVCVCMVGGGCVCVWWEKGACVCGGRRVCVCVVGEGCVCGGRRVHVCMVGGGCVCVVGVHVKDRGESTQGKHTTCIYYIRTSN